MVRAERHRREAEHQRADAEHAARERAERDKESIAAFAATLQQTLLPAAMASGAAGRVARSGADRGVCRPAVCRLGVLLPPGAGLLLYTDGLTEARIPGGRLLGQDGLAAFLARPDRCGPVSATGLVADAVAPLEQRSGGACDDVALLVLSVPVSGRQPATSGGPPLAAMAGAAA